MFNLWRENLPQHRTFKKHDRVCERHFHKDDIITSWEHTINGVVTTLERMKPMLKANAIPLLNFPAANDIVRIYSTLSVAI